MFLAKDERKREKTVQNEPARNRTLEPQRAPLELGELAGMQKLEDTLGGLAGTEGSYSCAGWGRGSG